MTTTQGVRAAQFIPFEKVKGYVDGNIPIVPLKANGDPHTSYLYENDAEKNTLDKDTLLNAEPSNFSHIRHVKSLGRNVKKHPIPPRRPVYTAAKVSMAGFTVRGLENEISYVQQDWPLVALKELGDNPYDFFKEFYSDSPKEHRGIAYNVWQPYPGNPDSAEYFIIRIAATSSNIDNRNVFEDLQLIFDLTKYCSSKRGQYKRRHR